MYVDSSMAGDLGGKMRHVVTGILCLLLASTALAQDLGHKYIKVTEPCDPGIPDGREGGETWEDAIVFYSLPFDDVGNTSDNLDDIDEDCPWAGDGAPDVWYEFYTPYGVEVDIDLCGSQYDTQVIVYANEVISGSYYACNDDECGLQSYIGGLYLAGGNTYYIAVDGYDQSSFGDYTFSITQSASPP